MHTKSICKTAAIVLMTVSCTQNKTYIDTIGVEVSAEENREYSYTDKKSGYWYGTTHQLQLFQLNSQCIFLILPKLPSYRYYF